jgi:hypothetical protein
MTTLVFGHRPGIQGSWTGCIMNGVPLEARGVRERGVLGVIDSYLGYFKTAFLLIWTSYVSCPPSEGLCSCRCDI